MRFNFTPFVSLAQLWLRLRSDEYETIIINLTIGAFYFPFVFCLGQSHLKASGLN